LAHHPIVFGGLKRFTGSNYVERTVIKAIKNDIAIYAAHTNLDSVLYNGVNSKIADKLGLINRQILSPVKDALSKLVVFVPNEHASNVRQAIFCAGAGTIGQYDNCSFNTEGQGTFKGNADSKPFVGTKGELHTENETRIETIVPNYLSGKVINAMVKAHPYEEVAYDLYPLKNQWDQVGAGIKGNLEQPMDELECLKWIKATFDCEHIRHTRLLGKPVKKIALCGGSGSFLLKDAIRSGADIFITGEKKVIEYVSYNARPILFSASMPPACVASALKSLEIMQRDTGLFEKVQWNAGYVRDKLQGLGFSTGDSVTPIVPVFTFDRLLTLQVAKALFEENVFVSPFIPPSVPEGQSLIRMSFMASHTKELLDKIIDAFERVGKKYNLI
jgi:hypothetical protein